MITPSTLLTSLATLLSLGPIPIPIPIPSSQEPDLPTDVINLPPADARYPVPNPSLSYWLQGVRNDPLLDYRSTEELPTTSGVVVIGSGMSGSLIAYSLLNAPNPPESVTLLEARETCSGATGRNAGHCKPDSYRGFLDYAKKFGKKEAKAILDLEWNTFESVVNFVREEEIDCDLWVQDTLDVALSNETAAEAQASYQAYLDYAGDDVKNRVEMILDVDEAVEVSRMKDAKAVWKYTAGSFYPWKVVAHLLRKSLALGLNLQTHTLVTSITPSHSHTPSSPSWIVHTSRGDIVTPKIVHATNAFASTLLPELQDFVGPTPFICNKVVPPKTFSGSKTLQHTYTVSITPDTGFSINPRGSSDGIILFGGSNPKLFMLADMVRRHPEIAGDDRLGNYRPLQDAVEQFTEDQFLGWGKTSEMAVGEGFDYSWSGIIGRTSDGLPVVGAVPGHPGQWVSAGHNGHGMARIFTVSPALAKMVLNTSLTYEDTGLPKCFEFTKDRVVDAGREIAVRPLVVE